MPDPAPALSEMRRVTRRGCVGCIARAPDGPRPLTATAWAVRGRVL
jgi:hypothetical protein